MIARSELGRRRGSLTLLAILVAVSSAVTLAGFAGARRTDSVLDRFLAATNARDVGAVIQSAHLIQNPDGGMTLRDRIAGIDGVRDVAMARGYPMSVGTKYDFSVASSPDGSYFSRIDAPVVLSGRLPHVSSVDEVAISDSVARELGLGPGDALQGTVFDPATVAAFISTVDLAPANVSKRPLSLRIVGVVRTQDELQGWQNGSAPIALASPAFDRAHRSDVGAAYTAFAIRGPARTEDLWTAINELPGAGKTSFGQVATIGEEVAEDADTAYRTIAAATLAFAAVALLVTLLTVTLATGRQISLASESDHVGWGLGLSRRQRVQALVAPPAIALGIGLTLGLAGALGLSWLFPVSTARLAEPSPGIRFDPIVHLGGSLLLAVVLGLSTVAIAVRALDRRSVGVVPKRVRWIPGAADAHVPAMVGLRQAFGTVADRRTVPSLGARVGAVVSVAGVIAVAVLMTSVHVAQNEPARFGWTWDSKPDLADPDSNAVTRVKEGLIAEPDVAAAAQLVGGVVEVDRTSLAVRAIDDLKGSTSFTVTRGRMPTGPDDVVLGRITMDDLEVDLGGQVVATDTDGTDHSMTVVGEAVLPTIDFGGNPGTGAAVTSDTFGRLVGDGSAQNLVLTYRAGVDRTVVERRLEQLGLGFPVYARSEPPGLIQQLDRMGSLALAMMLFLAGLASVGLVHFLAASVRGRRSEFGCLRALGLVRTQVWGAVTWQAVAISGVGLVLGIPAGIVLGRMAWQAAVGRLGMVDDPAVPVWAIVVVSAVVAVGAVVLAAGPGWLATRRAPATLLRSE